MANGMAGGMDRQDKHRSSTPDLCPSDLRRPGHDIGVDFPSRDLIPIEKDILPRLIDGVSEFTNLIVGLFQVRHVELPLRHFCQCVLQTPTRTHDESTQRQVERAGWAPEAMSAMRGMPAGALPPG